LTNSGGSDRVELPGIENLIATYAELVDDGARQNSG
jgi:hypothetical protein